MDENECKHGFLNFNLKALSVKKKKKEKIYNEEY